MVQYLSSQDFKEDSERKSMSFRAPVFASRFQMGKWQRLREVKLGAARLSVWITYASILLINILAYAGFLLSGVNR